MFKIVLAALLPLLLCAANAPVEITTERRLKKQLQQRGYSLLYFFSYFHSSHQHIMSLLSKVSKLKDLTDFQVLLINSFEHPEIARSYSIQQTPRLMLHKKDGTVVSYDSLMSYPELRTFVLTALNKVYERSPTKKSPQYDYEAVLVLNSTLQGSRDLEQAFLAITANYSIYIPLKQAVHTQFLSTHLRPHFEFRASVIRNVTSAANSSTEQPEESSSRPTSESAVGGADVETVEKLCDLTLQNQTINNTQINNYYKLTSFLKSRLSSLDNWEDTNRQLVIQNYIMVYQKGANITKISWLSDTSFSSLEKFNKTLSSILGLFSQPSYVLNSFNYKYMNYMRQQNFLGMIMWVKRKHYSNSFAIQRFLNETQSCYEKALEGDKSYQEMTRKTLFYVLDPLDSEDNLKLAHSIGLSESELPKLTLVYFDESKRKIARTSFALDVSKVNYIARNLLEFYKQGNYLATNSYEVARDKLVPMLPNTDSYVAEFSLTRLQELVMAGRALKRAIIVEFTSHYCQQCLQMWPVIDELSTLREFKHVVFGRLDVGLSQSWESSFPTDISRVPTIRVYQDSTMDKFDTLVPTTNVKSMRAELQQKLKSRSKADEL